MKTGDTDVIVLILAYFKFFDDPLEIEVDFGFGIRKKYHNINDISLNVPAKFRAGLLFFHSFTGSDLTSSFYSISKLTWWKLWIENDDVSDIFIKLSHKPASISEDDFVKLEKFVCWAYDQNQRFRTFNIDLLRYLLFSISTQYQLFNIIFTFFLDDLKFTVELLFMKWLENTNIWFFLISDNGYSVIRTQAIYCVIFSHSSSEFYSITESLQIRFIFSKNPLLYPYLV